MFTKNSQFLTGILIGVLALPLVGCGAQNSNIPVGQEKIEPVTLTGAGSTFVYPLLNQQIEAYRKNNPSIAMKLSRQWQWNWNQASFRANDRFWSD